MVSIRLHVVALSGFGVVAHLDQTSAGRVYETLTGPTAPTPGIGCVLTVAPVTPSWCELLLEAADSAAC